MTTFRVILVVAAAYVFVLSGILGETKSEIEKDRKFDPTLKPAR